MDTKKCTKCQHFYRTMTGGNGKGYNPSPFCHRHEDEGKSPDLIAQTCFIKKTHTNTYRELRG